MNLQQLRAIREIVRQDHNLTEAADALNTSQSGVSRQIRDLELELGIEIFRRRGKRFVGLTPAGLDVHGHAKGILSQIEALRRCAADHAAPDRGRLVVATTHNQSRHTLPPAVDAFLRRYPDVAFELQQGTPDDIVRWLLAGEADVGVASEALAECPDLIAADVTPWRHAIIAPADHPLVGTRITSLSQVAGWPLITYRSGISGRDSLDTAFAAVGLTPRVILAALDTDVIIDYVVRGLGIGIVAGFALATTPAGCERLEVAPGVLPEQVTRIAVAADTPPRAFALAFIRLVAPHLDDKSLLSRQPYGSP